MKYTIIVALLLAVSVDAHRIRNKDRMIISGKDTEDVETAMSAINDDEVAV